MNRWNYGDIRMPFKTRSTMRVGGSLVVVALAIGAAFPALAAPGAGAVNTAVGGAASQAALYMDYTSMLSAADDCVEEDAGSYAAAAPSPSSSSVAVASQRELTLTQAVWIAPPSAAVASAAAQSPSTPRQYDARILLAALQLPKGSSGAVPPAPVPPPIAGPAPITGPAPAVQSAQPPMVPKAGSAAKASTWDIKAMDRTLNAALARWAYVAGWQLLWEVPIDYAVEADTSIGGTFEQAVETVTQSMAGAEIPLKAVFYQGNRVLRIVAKGAE